MGFHAFQLKFQEYCSRVNGYFPNRARAATPFLKKKRRKTWTKKFLKPKLKKKIFDKIFLFDIMSFFISVLLFECLLPKFVAFGSKGKDFKKVNNKVSKLQLEKEKVLLSR